MSYHCPVCNKVSNTAADLGRHMIGRGDKVHRDWFQIKGFKYSELVALQMKSFSSEGGYAALTKLLEKETKVEDKVLTAEKEVKD